MAVGRRERLKDRSEKSKRKKIFYEQGLVEEKKD
jgi:hypothetical protein